MQNMELWQAVALGGLQGVAELFPISSLAQTILIPALLDWKFDQSQYLAFVVALHLATAVALVLYFWKDWLRVLKGFLGVFTRGRFVYDKDSKFAWLLVAGTIVVGVAGLVLEKRIRLLFDDSSKAWIVGAVLAVNGLIMIFGDFMKKDRVEHTPGELEHPGDLAMHAALTGGRVSKNAVADFQSMDYTKEAESLTFTKAAAIGSAQTLALLPGISRSGVTIVAGLFAGLTYEEASRFTFMLATPVIALAALKKVPELLKPENHDMLHLAIWGSVAAFVCAYASVAFLMKYFHTHRLSPFGYFCILFGLASAVFLKYQSQHDLTPDAGVNPSSQIVQQNAPTSG
jgi:undecaprenyl-diphosphatase